jgi:hypothetical protein
MAMKRVGAVDDCPRAWAWVLPLAIGLALLGACSTKPSEESCEKAVNNIRKLTGQSHTDVGADKRAAVRSCRAQSSKDTVECMAEARTAEELFACGGKMAEEVKKLMDAQKAGGAGAGSGSDTPAPEKEPAKGP